MFSRMHNADFSSKKIRKSYAVATLVVFFPTIIKSSSLTVNDVVGKTTK